MTGSAHWIVLRTQPRQEILAVHSVAARDVEGYFPLVARGRSSEPLFPGYIFARVAPGSDDLLRIRSAPGISYVLPRDAPAALLPDEFVGALRARVAERSSGYRRGDRVTIRRGPFRWLDAVFDRSVSASGRVRVLLDFVYRSVFVDLQVEDLG